MWYLAILGVAGAGLALDTFVIRAKATTEPAEVELQTSDTSPTKSRVLPTKPEPLGEQFDLAESRLEPPAFRRLDGFTKPKPDVVQIAQSESDSPSGAFGARHKLTAVLSQPSGDLAVVDGLLLRVGDTVEGLKLVKIENDGAIFEGEDKSIRLPLARPAFDR